MNVQNAFTFQENLAKVKNTFGQLLGVERAYCLPRQKSEQGFCTDEPSTLLESEMPLDVLQFLC